MGLPRARRLGAAPGGVQFAAAHVAVFGSSFHARSGLARARLRVEVSYADMATGNCGRRSGVVYRERLHGLDVPHKVLDSGEPPAVVRCSAARRDPAVARAGPDAPQRARCPRMDAAPRRRSRLPREPHPPRRPPANRIVPQRRWLTPSRCGCWAPIAGSASASRIGRMAKREQAQEHFTIATTMYREMDILSWLEKAEQEMDEP